MAQRDRLLSLFDDNNKMIAFITYYFGTGDMSKYINRDPWSIIEDEPNGDIMYIDQIISNKKEGNQVYSWQVWRNLIKYTKKIYPKVKEILWRRYKEGKVHVRRKSLRR